MRFFNNKKGNNEVVDAVLKEGEKIYREVKNEETGEVTYVEIEIPDKKKEETEDEKSEKKSAVSKLKTTFILAGTVFAAGMTGAVMGAKAAASKGNKSESIPTENQESDNNAE